MIFKLCQASVQLQPFFNSLSEGNPESIKLNQLKLFLNKQTKKLSRLTPAVQKATQIPEDVFLMQKFSPPPNSVA